MDTLSNLLEALLASLAIIGTAALHMVFLVWIIFAAFLVIALLRFGIAVAWRAGVRAYRGENPFSDG